MDNPVILIVEDERIVAEDMKETLKNLGYHVPAIAISGELAIEKAGEFHPDLILMDIFLAGQMNGIEAAEKIRELYGIPVIYLTAYADKQIMAKAKVTEPYGYILKPYDERELHTAIEIALYKHTMDTKLKESEERYRGFVQNFLGIAFRQNIDFSPIFLHGAVEGITGYTENEFKAGTVKWLGIVHADDTMMVRDTCRKVQGTAGSSVEREYRIIRKDGRTRWVFELIQHTPASHGNAAFIQGTIYDITERKLAEDGVRKRDAILLAVGFAVEWFLRAPQIDGDKERQHVWGDRKDVEQILEQVGLAVNARSVGIFSIHEEETTRQPLASICYEWDAPGSPSFLHNPLLKNINIVEKGFGQWNETLMKGNYIAGNVSDFAAPEQSFLTPFGFHSLAIIPIIRKDSLSGFMVFITKDKRSWPPEEIEGLRIVANIVSLVTGYHESSQESEKAVTKS